MEKVGPQAPLDLVMYHRTLVKSLLNIGGRLVRASEIQSELERNGLVSRISSLSVFELQGATVDLVSQT